MVTPPTEAPGDPFPRQKAARSTLCGTCYKVASRTWARFDFGGGSGLVPSS